MPHISPEALTITRATLYLLDEQQAKFAIVFARCIADAMPLAIGPSDAVSLAHDLVAALHRMVADTGVHAVPHRPTPGMAGATMIGDGVILEAFRLASSAVLGEAASPMICNAWGELLSAYLTDAAVSG